VRVCVLLCAVWWPSDRTQFEQIVEVHFVRHIARHHLAVRQWSDIRVLSAGHGQRTHTTPNTQHTHTHSHTETRAHDAYRKLVVFS